LVCETRSELARLRFVRERLAFFVGRSRPEDAECCTDFGRRHISGSHVASVVAYSATSLDECASGGDSVGADVANRAF
jgi:hypothetical protein